MVEPDNVKSRWTLIAHGGAKDISAEDEPINREGLRDAVVLGREILAGGGSALDAVVAVVKSLEANPAYNAGLNGSVKNEDGEIEMDASIMDGSTLDIGAVAGLQDIEHPVLVAYTLLREKAILLVGQGAMMFARKNGFLGAQIPASERKSAPGCDTVGCVARDQNGRIAVATSTGGLEGAKVGRVGDVPLPGCGFYADNDRGGVSVSGEGEAIARVMLSAEFLNLLLTATPEESALRSLKFLERIKGEAGLIGIAPNGDIGWAHNSPNFAVGMLNESDQQPRVYLKKDEEKI